MKYRAPALALALASTAGRVATAEPTQPIAPAIVVGKAPKSDGPVAQAIKETGINALRAGHYLEAARLLHAAKEAGADDDDLELALLEVKKHVAEVRIVTAEPDTNVVIDGIPYNRVPGFDDIFMRPGKHRITATKKGFDPLDLTFDIQAGELRELPISLVPQEQTLYKSVMANPVQVQMNVNGTATPPAEVPTWPTKVMIGGFLSFSVGSAIAITGLVMSTDDTMGTAPGLWRGVTIGGAIVGCLGLGLGIIGWASKPAPPPPPVIIQPVITQQQTGVGLSGRW